MLLVVFAAIAGGLATGAALLPHGGLVVALLAAPLGGSLSALLAGLVNLRRTETSWRFEADLEAQTDAMVAELRSLVAQGMPQDGGQSQPARWIV